MRKLLLAPLLFSLIACGSQQNSAGEVMPEEPTTIEEDNGSLDTGGTPTTPADFDIPGKDPAFVILPDGRKLSSIKVRGSSLSLAKGTGTSFTAAKQAEYLKLKQATQTDAAHKVQWVFMDLDAHKVIEKSKSSSRKIFGASSSKIYVAAALLNKQNGKLSESQLQLMADMLVVSSNEAWVALQKQIGDGSADKGRERIHAFTQSMGYLKMLGFQGTWGSLHGNELVADESAETLFDIYTNSFPGADLEWKIMHTCRTGASRGRKYIPKSIYVGGKTGTYDGPTVDGDSGKAITVHVRNHILTFNVDNHQYGLVVFADNGSDESAALLAGGLIREYTGAK